jgi:transcriptional regulator with XRE-family HTH domain
MSQIVDDLGPRLRRLREQQGWSLSELAQYSGVSRAMINRVERGLSSPTAAILGRLSGAFGLTVSQLLEPERRDANVQPPAGPDHVLRDRDAASWTDPDTGYERRPLSSASFPADVTAVSLPSGRSVTYPASAYAFLRHLVRVTDGELTLERPGGAVVLAAGDGVELGEPTETTYRNDGAEPCRYVVIAVRVH